MNSVVAVEDLRLVEPMTNFPLELWELRCVGKGSELASTVTRARVVIRDFGPNSVGEDLAKRKSAFPLHLLCVYTPNDLNEFLRRQIGCSSVFAGRAALVNESLVS
jgi:hypothetical protein